MPKLFYLFIIQFLSAFIDNAAKNAVALMIAFGFAASHDLNAGVMVALSSGLLTLPFFMFSGIAGQLADKYNKRTIIIRLKAFEIVIALFAAYGFLNHSLIMLMISVFMFGTQSAFFGPIKYSIIPELLKSDDESRLVGANGLINSGTFIAILLGTLWGGFSISIGGNGAWILSISMVVLSLISFLFSFTIPASPLANAGMKLNLNPITSTWQIASRAFVKPETLKLILLISWFWFIGATILTQLPLLTKNYLGGDERTTTILLAMFTIGISIGAALLKLFGRKIYKYALLIIGLMFMIIPITFNIGITSAMLNVLVLAIAGGVYSVPLYSRLQAITKADERARIIGANNIINALAMVISALLIMAFAMLPNGLIITLITVGILSLIIHIYAKSHS